LNILSLLIIIISSSSSITIGVGSCSSSNSSCLVVLVVVLVITDRLPSTALNSPCWCASSDQSCDCELRRWATLLAARAPRADVHVAHSSAFVFPIHLTWYSTLLFPHLIDDGKLYGKERDLLWLLLFGASRQGLVLPAINGCYGSKDNSVRNELCSLIGRDEFLLRSYRPSLGRAGETCATVTRPPEIVLIFTHVWTPMHWSKYRVTQVCVSTVRRLLEESPEEWTLWNPEVSRVPESQKSPLFQTCIIGQNLS
jgi:hypothetical protein